MFYALSECEKCNGVAESKVFANAVFKGEAKYSKYVEGMETFNFISLLEVVTTPKAL